MVEIVNYLLFVLLTIFIRGCISDYSLFIRLIMPVSGYLKTVWEHNWIIIYIEYW